MDLYAMPETHNIFRFLRNAEKLARLVSIRQAVEPILTNNLQTEFTDHSRNHSDNVAQLVNRLVEPLQDNTQALDERELFILYAACYLHDIGMQYENAGTTETIASLGLDARAWANLTSDVRDDHLRRQHHRLSAELVMRSVRSGSPPIGISLSDEDEPGSIAALCEAHNLWMNGKDHARYTELINDSAAPLRLDLLSGLLRMADILEESRGRACRSKADTLLLPLESQVHWWRHYYTKEVAFDRLAKTITLQFDFPSEKRGEYARLIPQLQVPHIQKELARHQLPFARNGLQWVVGFHVLANVYSSAEDMPSEVLARMHGMLREEQAYETAALRQSTVGIVDTARPLVDRLLAEIDHLPADTLPEEKARHYEEAANHMKLLGALRQEETFASSAYDAYSRAGDTARQLSVGLRVVPMMLRRGQAFLATRFASDLEEILDAASASPQQRLDAATVKSRALLGLGYSSPQAEESYQRAITLAEEQRVPTAIQELRSELGLMYFLEGEGEKAMAVLPPLVSESDTFPHSDFEGTTSPLVRSALMYAQMQAESSDVSGAVELINKQLALCTPTEQNTANRFALTNTKAYLLFQVEKFDEAAACLSTFLESGSLDGYFENRLALERNLLRCRVMLPRDTGHVLLSRDRYQEAAESAGIPEEAAASILQALTDRVAGKKNDSYPRLWRELMAAYNAGDWQRYWAAEKYMAQECLGLGWVGRAAAHTTRGNVDGMAEAIGQLLLAEPGANSERRENYNELIRATVAQATSSSLNFHFAVGSETINNLVDVLPLDCIDDCFNYLLEKAILPVYNLVPSFGVAKAAWTALAALGPRLNEQQADRFITHLSHLDLTAANPFLLKEAFNSLAHIVPTLSTNGLREAAQLAVNFAERFPQNDDHQLYYRSVIRVLSLVCSLGGDDIANAVSPRLFETGAARFDPLKWQLLPLFPNVKPEEGWTNKLAVQAAQNLRLQVQDGEVDETSPKPPGNSGHISIRDAKGNHVVYMIHSDRDELPVLVANRESIEAEPFTGLLDACLEMAENPYTIPANRVGLLEAVAQFASRLTPEQRTSVWEVVIRIAKSNGASAVIDLAEGVGGTSPLSAFKINMGTRASIRAGALGCVGHLYEWMTSEEQNEAQHLLTESLLHPDPILRRETAISAQYISSVDETVLTALVWGLRDTNPEVATACFWALTHKKHLHLDSTITSLLVNALRLAAKSNFKEVRRGAAALTTRIDEWIHAEGTTAAEIESVRRALMDDPCYSVRHIFDEAKEFNPTNQTDLVENNNEHMLATV